MTVDWRRPFSRNINRVGHDPDTGEMFVEWRDGRISIYDGVSPEKFDLIHKAPSVTQAINMEIKPSHTHRYLPRH